MYLGNLEHGKVIRRLRIERHLSIEDVAELIDEDVEFIKELEDEMHPDIPIGIFYILAQAFEMDVYDLLKEISIENRDYINRITTHRGSKIKIMLQRDKQRKRSLQKKITHNFKNKQTKQPLKRKIANIEKNPTTSIKKLNQICEIY